MPRLRPTARIDESPETSRSHAPPKAPPRIRISGRPRDDGSVQTATTTEEESQLLTSNSALRHPPHAAQGGHPEAPPEEPRERRGPAWIQAHWSSAALDCFRRLDRGWVSDGLMKMKVRKQGSNIDGGGGEVVHVARASDGMRRR
eukprot:3546933-Pyramimonas_sp.AAC.1